MLFLRLHPKPMQYTPSYEFTVSFVGVGFGTVSGTARTVASYEVFNRMGPHLLTQQGVLFILRRMFVGASYLSPVVCEQAVCTVAPSAAVLGCILFDLSRSSALPAGEESCCSTSFTFGSLHMCCQGFGAFLNGRAKAPCTLFQGAPKKKRKKSAAIVTFWHSLPS